MPTSASAATDHRSPPEDLLRRLTSSSSGEAKLKALRDLKNQIIGNPTRKLSYLKLNAVPSVVSILSSAVAIECGDEVADSIVIQAAAVLGSFACGLDDGAMAVIHSGAFDLLLNLMDYPNLKVVDAVARALKLIYQSKFAPKFDIIQEKSMEYLISLLKDENENLTGLGASIIAHSCQTNIEQRLLSDTGATERLLALLRGSLAQRDASLESLASIFKDNQEVTSTFVGHGNGRMLRDIVDLTKDKCPRTRLLACMLLITIRNADPLHLQDIGLNTKLIEVLFELVHDSGQVGDEAPFAISKLISDNEDVQKLVFDANGVDRLCECFGKYVSQPRRLEGIFLALADLCSKLECCRSRFLSLKGLDFVGEALGHDRAEICAAACICLRNVARSLKNLSSGEFMNETLIHLLLQLLCDNSLAVQVAAFGAINNIVVDFMPHKTVALKSGALKIIIGLSKSMDSTIRLYSVRALRNLAFLASCKCKQEILLELTQCTLKSLICDSEASIQEHTLALVCNLVDGSVDSIECILAEDNLLLNAVKRKLENGSKDEVMVQALYVLSNVASSNELHKEVVMQLIFPQNEENSEPVIFNLLKSNDSRIRTAAGWILINLTLRGTPGTFGRVTKLRKAGIVPLLKNMMNDRCMDAKLRAKTALYQVIENGD